MTATRLREFTLCSSREVSVKISVPIYTAWLVRFAEGPQLIHYDPKEGIGEGFRHGETFVVDDSLFILFTRMGDAPGWEKLFILLRRRRVSNWDC